MPYFSFSVNETQNINFQKIGRDLLEIKKNSIYYSKNTLLWKLLNKEKNKKYINFIKFEKREKIKALGKNILFFLPPSIGLGDAVEYALAIKAISINNKFNNIGIAYVGNYKIIFDKYFNLKNLYENVISLECLNEFDTFFHITLEIGDFTFQKYNRQDIEDLITSYFFVKKFRKKNFIKPKNNNLISIFPISKSPIRTMTVSLLNQIINSLNTKYNIEVIMDKNSSISNFIEKNIINNKIKIFHPVDVEELLSTIEKIDFGIFMDSGPLHVAKILNKKGVLITSTVSEDILLNGFENIISFRNNYKSKFCNAPCGLTNIFNLDNKIGCYDSLKIEKKSLMKEGKLNELQRGNLKKKYINFVSNPVNCLQNIDNTKITNKIKKILSF